jgi:CheY-like chemotaxis protein
VNGRHKKQILMIGNNTPLVEGVHDLLQVVGYPVRRSSSWTVTQSAAYERPPNLVIVDLSNSAPDAHQLAEEIWHTPQWSDVPILFLSFSGDDRARELQLRNNRNGQLHFYVHTLLGVDDLVEKVEASMA